MLHSENIALDASFASRISETGFDVFILLSILKVAVPSHIKLKGFSLETVNTTKPLLRFFEPKPRKKSRYKLNKVVAVVEKKEEVAEKAVSEQGGNSDTDIALTKEEKRKNCAEMELEECLGFYKSSTWRS